MHKVIITACTVLAMSTAMAFAGSATLKKADGSRIQLSCNNGGCFIKERDAAGNKGKRTRIGPGGSDNFKRHKAYYNSQGYK